MEIISENKKINNFQLAFTLKNGANGSEFLDYNLPYPNTVQHCSGFVRLMWLINGYAGTKKSREYLNDIIARFIISYNEYEAQRVPFKLDKLQNDTLHELKEFQTLESIKRRSYDISRSESMSHAQDQVFFAIKFYAEQLIISYGFCQYDRLEDFAISNFLDRKDKSTLKAKCRSIYYWYEERDFKITNYQKKYTTEQQREQLKMTRADNMLKVTKAEAEKNERLVKNAISGLMATEYKKPNGKWNVSKLSKELKLARNTVMKYLEA
jgi:hypothetical protein